MIVCLISSCKYFHMSSEQEYRLPLPNGVILYSGRYFVLQQATLETSPNGVTMFHWCAEETLPTRSIGIIIFWPDVAVYLCIPHSYMDALGLLGMTTFLYPSQPFVINVIKSFIYKTIINIVVVKMLVLKELGVWCVVPFFIRLK